MDPPQATAKPISQFGDAAVKTYVKKGQTRWKESGGGNKKRKSRGQRRRRRSMAEQAHPQRDCSPWRNPRWSTGKKGEGRSCGEKLIHPDCSSSMLPIASLKGVSSTCGGNKRGCCFCFPLPESEIKLADLTGRNYNWQ